MLEQMIAEFVLEFLSKAKAKNLIPLDYMPTISYDLTGSTAGMAHSYSGRLRFNIPLLNRVSNEEIRQVAGHEVAHLVADYYYKKRCIHKREWRSIMAFFGLRVERCHSYDVSGLKRTRAKVLATCGCGPREIGITRYKRMQQGKAYRCLVCNQRIK